MSNVHYRLASEDTYKGLSTFNTVKDMDDSIRKHRNVNKISKTDTDILEVISRHSCVFPGVSYLTKNNIGKMVGRTRRTVIRACLRLEEMGIIKQYDLKRNGGDRRQTSNAIVIQPYQCKSTEVTAEKAHHKAKEPIKLIKSNTYKETVKDAEKSLIPTSSLRHSIPTIIYEAMSPFYDAKSLYEVYGILIRAKASIDRSITFEEYGKHYIDVFMNVIRKYKLGEVRNVKGLLYAAWQSVSSQISRIRNRDVKPVYYDWLNN